MKHFLAIDQLTQAQVVHLLHRAAYFKSTGDYPQFPAQTMATLFYEPSTRTRVSFEIAARHLGMGVVTMAAATSSETKGEQIEDTLQTLFAMGIRLFVVRHRQNGLPQGLANTVMPGGHVINAGDGTHEHPSQALLDLMTIMAHKPNLNQLKITVVGDVLHSRVTNSLRALCALMAVKELVLVAPEVWHPQRAGFGRVTSSLQEGLQDADVIMVLRVQKERLLATELFDLAQYRQLYAVTTNSITGAKPDVMIMHPGPINRGLEIDSALADGPQSYILEQVSNGVFMRMAMLEACLAG